MWEPITSAETARECWKTIGEIEQALAAHLASQASHPDPYRDPLLASGDAGLALFFGYLHAVAANSAAADRALDAIELSTAAAAQRHLLPSFYAGVFGVGWVVSHLTRELFEGDGDLTSELDDALRALLDGLDPRSPFELIGGLAGYGTYLVERLPHPGAAEMLARIVDLLDASRDERGVWFTDPAWMPEWQRALMPHGYHNLGVAHGVPGVIGFLAAAWREGFRDARVPPLVRDAMHWLAQQRRDDLGGSIFPAHVGPHGEVRPTRTAWCYGDTGVAGVMLSAARAFDRSDWEHDALAIARLAARRSLEETLAVDSGLCHGAIGLAHLFNRFHQATGDAELKDAAQRWYGRTLANRTPGEGIAGILSWVDTAPGEGEWKGEPGFLSGVAGVGLALLAAVSDVEPVWDRVLLVATPPRNGSVQ